MSREKEKDREDRPQTTSQRQHLWARIGKELYCKACLRNSKDPARPLTCEARDKSL
jgi:hypothetical protein